MLNSYPVCNRTGFPYSQSLIMLSSSNCIPYPQHVQRFERQDLTNDSHEPSQIDYSWCWVFLHNLLDFLVVGLAIFLEQIICFCLCWRFRVGIIQKVLNSKKDLLDRDCRLPSFLFVKDRETDGSRWIDIWME